MYKYSKFFTICRGQREMVQLVLVTRSIHQGKVFLHLLPMCGHSLDPSNSITSWLAIQWFVLDCGHKPHHTPPTKAAVAHQKPGVPQHWPVWATPLAQGQRRPIVAVHYLSRAHIAVRVGRHGLELPFDPMCVGLNFSMLLAVHALDMSWEMTWRSSQTHMRSSSVCATELGTFGCSWEKRLLASTVDPTHDAIAQTCPQGQGRVICYPQRNECKVYQVLAHPQGTGVDGIPPQPCGCWWCLSCRPHHMGKWLKQSNCFIWQVHRESKSNDLPTPLWFARDTASHSNIDLRLLIVCTITSVKHAPAVSQGKPSQGYRSGNQWWTYWQAWHSPPQIYNTCYSCHNAWWFRIWRRTIGQTGMRQRCWYGTMTSCHCQGPPWQLCLSLAWSN